MKFQNYHHLTLLLLLLLPSSLQSLQQQSDCEKIFKTGSDPSTLRILHISNPCSPFKPQTPLSWEQAILQMQVQDQARIQFLDNLVVGPHPIRPVVPIATGQAFIQRPNYILRAGFGDPEKPMYVAVDTGNDITWIPCEECDGCSSSSSLFNPKISKSFQGVKCSEPVCKNVQNFGCAYGGACTYNLTYGTSNISTIISQDTLTLGAQKILKFSFGCVKKTSGSLFLPQGLLGLGRGPLSLMAQTKPIYNSIFSYCLPSFTSFKFTGSLKLGPKYQPKRMKFTPLLQSLRRPSLYYVEMLGIRVGRRVLDIPRNALAFNRITGAGTIIDSGTVFTRLVTAAYIPLRDAFRLKVGKNKTATSLGGFDTCYSGTLIPTTVTFMFRNLNMTLPFENIMIHRRFGDTACLAMAAAPLDGYNAGLNVIASMQQQNHRVVYDGVGSRLGVAREVCA